MTIKIEPVKSYRIGINKKVNDIIISEKRVCYS